MSARCWQASAKHITDYGEHELFGEPAGDWDRDRVPNRTELDFGMRTCTPEPADFCDKQPGLCTVRYVPAIKRTHGTYWNWTDVNADPKTDWDGDGIKNTEARKGSNPCAHPCSRPSAIAVSLSPKTDWDRDGVSNRNELYNRTEPTGYPYYSVVTGLCHSTKPGSRR